VTWPAAAVFPHHRLIQGPVLKQEVHITVWIAAYATASMAGPKRHRRSGCTQVQSYSDQELFWIINNGIRFSGMPGFGKLETPDHIWGLVTYVRALPSDSRRRDPAN